MSLWYPVHAPGSHTYLWIVTASQNTGIYIFCMIQVLKIAFNCWLQQRWMEEIYRTAAVQSLPVVCNGARNISYVHHSCPFQAFPGHCANPTAERSPQPPLPSCPPTCWADGPHQETATRHRRLVGPAGWVPSGKEWKKKRRKGKSQQTNKTELKRNASVGVGKMSPAPRWNCPDRLSYLCPRHATCLDSQENGWIRYPNTEWRSSLLCCDTDQSTRLLLDISRTWWRERWANLPG